MESKWLTGISAPVGTLLGPNAFNQYFTVAEVDVEGKKVLVRRAQIADTHRGQLQGLLGAARSMAEHEFHLMGRDQRARGQYNNDGDRGNSAVLPRKARRKLKKK